MLDIRTNGSHFAGTPPSPLEALHTALADHTLDPTFERHGNFVEPEGAATRFFGNFWDVSHVFQVATDEPAVIRDLTARIRANQATPAYQRAKEALARYTADAPHREAARARRMQAR